MNYNTTRHIRTRVTFLSLLCIVGVFLTGMHAQESCYEQYLREHNMKILTTEDADDSYDELKKTVLAKQMYGDSYLLMVDTIAQRVMFTKGDGTYIADVHVALVDSTWYMWLSVDPLADKNIAYTPYMYCNGNPIMLIDPDGRDWTDIDGNTINDHSNIKAYIFYDPDEFGSQSMEMAHQLEEKYGVGSVAMSNVKTEKGFRQDWRAMASSNIKEVNLNYHGSNQAIHLDYKNGEYITSTGLGTTRLGTEALNVRDIGAPIGNIMNARLNLNTCHSASEGSWLGNLTLGGMRLIPGTSATLVGTNQTIMESFFNNFNFSVVRGTSAGVSYNRKTQQPEPQFFFQSWVYLFHK